MIKYAYFSWVFDLPDWAVGLLMGGLISLILLAAVSLILQFKGSGRENFDALSKNKACELLGTQWERHGKSQTHYGFFKCTENGITTFYKQAKD